MILLLYLFILIDDVVKNKMQKNSYFIFSLCRFLIVTPRFQIFFYPIYYNFKLAIISQPC